MPPQHATPIDPKELLRELEDHNDYFDELVDMIPSHIYIRDEEEEKEASNPKYRKGQNKRSKQAQRARNKTQKRKKQLDPTTAETTTQIKRRKEEHQDDDDDDDNDNEDSNSMTEIMMQDQHEEEQEQQEKPPQNEPNPQTNTTSSSSNENKSRIEALRAKLRAKLNAQRRSENGTTTARNGSSALVSKRAARRAEKRRRIELAKRRTAANGGGSSSSGGSTRTGRREEHDGKISLVQNEHKLTEKELGGSKLISSSTAGDDLSTIDFGGIAGLKNTSTSVLNGNYNSTNKSLKNLGKKKSLERLLAEAESKKERLEQLKASDDVEDKEKAKKIIWGDTLKAASGERTKDDPALLRKAIKRKAKKKSKSQESWKTRVEQVQEKMDERQTIRQHNIGQRKIGGAAGANLSKKRIETDEDGDGEGGKGGGGSLKKRPRLGPHSGKARAGFEGKKQDFINKGGKAGGTGKRAQ